ncbi:MAG: iron-containing alcohol dehydrogenase [Verrucomicrobiales bacterium]|nr:iron-containing alcohol dehydrogenase [Verrucomicrobiales bacterium]
MSISVFRIANRLITGQGAIKSLNEELSKLGVKRPLIVSDRILNEIGVVAQVRANIPDVETEVFTGVLPEPETDVVEACKAAFLAGNHDGLIAVGGGSVVDTAKVVSVYAGLDSELSDLFEADSVKDKGFPLIAIPTTAGTGSEVTNIAVLSDKKSQLKRGIVSDFMLPDVAILAPEMTVTMPPSVTAASGVDALVHAIEAYLSVNASPVTDALALQAMKMITKYLPKAFGNPNDLEAREQMVTASLLAGMAFGNAGVGAVHALAYPLGGRYNIAHGVSNALLLPFVMEWNKLCCLERFRDIAIAMHENVKGLSDHETADLAVAAMHRLCKEVNIPSGLKSFGIPESALAEMADDAIKIERLLKNNPRVFSRDEIEAIYRSAF